MKHHFIWSILFFLLFKAGTVFGYELEVKSLKCEFQANPVGIETRSPGFSWQLYSDQRNIIQETYQLLVASSVDLLNMEDADIWSPGEVHSNKSIQINYDGEALKSATRYYWKVRVKDQHGVYSPFSEASFFETGLFEQGDWRADWIYAPALGPDAILIAPGQPLHPRDAVQGPRLGAGNYQS